MSSPISEILVIDDNAETLAWLVETLATEGLRVRPADSGSLALQSAGLRPPDLVLVEVRMAGMDGYEVCRRLKENPATAKVPVIFISGLLDVEDRVRGYAAGGADYLVKPMQKQDLLARVKTHLRLGQIQRSLVQRTKEVETIRERLETEVEFHLGAQTILDEAPALVYALDLEGRFLVANRALLQVLGGDPQRVLGHQREAFLPAETAAAHRAGDLAVLASGETREFEERTVLEDGEHIYWSVKFPMKNLNGEVIGIGGISTDISAQRRLENDRDRLLDLYATLSKANEAMLRATDEADLFREICRVCVEAGHFDLAWVGTVKDGQILPLAAAGPMQGYLEGLELRVAAEDPRGQGPTGRAFREGIPVVCQDWATDPRMDPWRAHGNPFDIKASACFPVRTRAGLVAGLTLYSRFKGFFQPDRVALLEELAKDLAFALDKFATERQRQEAQTSLREQQALFEDLVKTQPAGISRIRVRPSQPAAGQTQPDPHPALYQIEFVSDRFCEILGLSRERFQVGPFAVLERIHPEDREAFSERNANALAQRVPFLWEGRLDEATGPRWVRFESAPRVLADGSTLWTGVLMDTTEQHSNRERIDHQFALLKGILESSAGPIFSVDRAYRYTSFNQAHAEVMQAIYGCDIALGMNLLDCQNVAEDRRITRTNLDRALAGESFLEEAPSGDDALAQRAFEVAHNPVQERDGSISGAAVFARDVTERQRAEKKLRDSLVELQRLREALDRVSAFIYMKDAQSRYVYANRPTLELFGCSAEDLLGSDEGRFFPAATVAKLQAVDARVFQGEETAEEIVVRDAEGGLRAYWEIKTPIYSDPERRTIWGLLGISTDISSVKQAEDLLRRKEARLRTMLQTTRDGVWLLEAEGAFLEMNDTACRMLGYSREEMLALRLADLEAAENPEEIRQRLERIASNGCDLFESLHRRKDGTLLPVEISISTASESGQMVVFVRDISERKQAEERIRRVTDLLRHSDALARVGGWEVDLETLELFWTDEIYHIYEVDPESYHPTLESSIQFYAPESRPVIAQAVEEAIRTGVSFDLELAMITGKGRRIQVHATSELLYKEGRAIKLLGAFQDITAAKGAEEVLRRTSDLLRQSEALAKVGGWEVDLTANTLFWTEETYRIHDLEPGTYEPTLKTALDFYAPEWRPTINAAVAEAVATGRNFNLKLELLTATGRRIWVHTTSQTEMQEGRVVKLLGAFRDISEEVAALEALEMGRERYRLLTENAKDVVWTLDAETLRFTYVSPSVERLRGFTPDEIMAEPVDAALTPEGSKLVRERLESRVAAMKSGLDQPHTYHTEEVQQPCKDGSMVWTEVVTSYFRDAATGHVWVLGVTRDISDRWKALDELRRTRDFLENLINAASAPIIVWDPEFRITRCNRAFERMVDHSAAEMLGQPLESIFPMRSRNASVSMIAKTAIGGQWEALELPVLRKDGSARVALWNSAPLFAEDGKTILATIAHGQDITERLHWERLLSERERRYRAIFETSADGLVLLDRESMAFLDANPAFCAVYGYTWEELQGMKATDVSAEPDQTQAATQVGVARVGLRWHRSKDGRVFPVEMVANSFQMEERVVNVVSIRDITERLRLENELHILNKELELRVVERTRQLEDANQELEAFAYSVSHDLRAPLRAISGFSETLMQRCSTALGESGLDHLQRIHFGAVRMSELIDDILRLSRVGRDELIVVPMDLAPMGREVFQQFQERHPARKVELRVEGPMPVQGDPRLLRIVLENLIGNAWKFTARREVGLIEMGREPGQEQAFFVKDNGVGFSMALAGRLFAPFQRLHKPSEFEGTGIGLALAKRIIVRHGGTISAQSEPDQGATIRFTLPMNEQAIR